MAEKEMAYCGGDIDARLAALKAESAARLELIGRLTQRCADFKGNNEAREKAILELIGRLTQRCADFKGNNEARELAIKERIDVIEADSRYQAGLKRPATIDTNAPLALIQLELEIRHKALTWALNLGKS